MPRVAHDKVIECYSDSSTLITSRPQAQAFEALLQIWDSHREWSDNHLLALIIATVASETANFRVRNEILSFPSAERIQSLWPTHFSTVAAAKPFVNNPQALAEEVYKGRFGNTDPGDGWRYRGRGMAMLLGREEYARYRQIVGLDLIANPDLVLIPAVGARVAFEAYFPASTISAISEIFLKNPDNWQGAIGAVHRVFDKDGIETKSKVLYDCINNAVISKQSG